MLVIRFRKLAISLSAFALFSAAILGSSPWPTRADETFDAATAYKDSKCMMCHGAAAERHFDATKADDSLAEAVMKGVKGEKPPFMPAYGEKGMTDDHAKALVAYMKTLKK